MVMCAMMLWSSNIFVLTLSSGEVEAFVRTNVRFMVWGVFFVHVGIIGFIPRIALLVSINSASSIPAVYTCAMAGVLFLGLNAYVVVFLRAVFVMPSYITTMYALLGGFGLPGTNQLHPPIEKALLSFAK